MHLFRTAVFAALAGAVAAVADPVVPINLATWQERGPAANGSWTVAAGGNSVTQGTNGNPTFFVSGGNQIDTTLRGTVRVGITGDDDFIGFVMGFNGPAVNGNNMDFVLLDWKQTQQTSGAYIAQEGFALSRVNGTITNYQPGFWGRTDSSQFDVLGTLYGAGKGWEDNTTYTFEILYQASRVKIDVMGGAYATPTTIFDIAGNFPAGSFGFYNYSQQGVTYAGFTEQSTPVPPPPPPTGVPEPSEVTAFAACIAGLALPGLRRRASR